MTHWCSSFFIVPLRKSESCCTIFLASSGLDPISASEFDELVVKLRDTMDLTVYMVTHDLDTLFTACDRVAVLGNKKILVEGTIDDMLKSEEPWVKSYFRGKRARQLDLAARA